MKVQEFIKEKGWAALKEELFIDVREYDNGLRVLNYDQISSPKMHPVVMECRALKLDQDGNVVSRAFDRFFNYGEGDTKNFDFSDCTVFEKADGCLDEKTLIKTEDGEKPIKEICETKYSGKILGYCHETLANRMTKIVGHSISTSKKQWYLITLKNGTKLKLTGNHRVWLEELRCYRRVDQLVGNEFFTLC